jgi:hypothetical protein
MEGHSIHSKNAPAGSKRAVIVASWEAAGKPPVDARLLKSIRAGLQREFENHEPDGPAAIARVLADAGAELRHPEIIEADAEWRQATLESEANESGLELVAAEIMTLASAEMFILKLEDLRQQQGRDADQRALAKLRSIAVEARRLAESIAKSRSSGQAIRAEQAEIAEWLKLWLQTPALFNNWLELRRRSDEFRTKFRGLNHEDTKTQND